MEALHLQRRDIWLPTLDSNPGAFGYTTETGELDAYGVHPRQI